MDYFTSFFVALYQSFWPGKIKDQYIERFSGPKFNLFTNVLLLLCSIMVSVHSVDIAMSITSPKNYVHKDKKIDRQIESKKGDYILSTHQRKSLAVLFMVMFWAACFIIRETAQSSKLASKEYRYLKALLKTPPEISFNRFVHLMKSTNRSSLQFLEKGTIDHLRRSIEQNLLLMRHVISKFSGEEIIKEDIGVNIMIAVSFPSKEGNKLKKCVKFDTTGVDSNKEGYLLWLRKDLLLAQGLDELPSDLPCPDDICNNSFVLYVPGTQEDFVSSDGERLYNILPGAPLSYRSGSVVVYEDGLQLSSFVKEQGNFAPQVADEILHYFSPSGEGSNYKSFISMPIGDTFPYTGILNVDCKKPYLLGQLSEYLGTLKVMALPILMNLDRLLPLYIEKTKKPLKT